MKPLTKSFFLFLSFLVLFNFSCDDEPQFAEGFVHDYDMTLCGCCGGFMVTIDDKEYKFSENDLPSSAVASRITQDNLPLAITLQYKVKSGCSGGRINITKVKSVVGIQAKPF